LEEEFLADEATENKLALFWEAMAVPEMEKVTFPYFWE